MTEPDIVDGSLESIDTNRMSSRTRACKRCKFTTTDAKDFLHHQLNAHTAEATEIHSCDDCEYASASYTEWQKHRRTHSVSAGRHKRLHSDESEPESGALLIDEAEGDGEDSEEEAAEDGTYICRDCGECHTSVKRHLRHMKDAHDIAITVYECDLCSFATKHKQRLAGHRKYHHNVESLSDATASQADNLLNGDQESGDNSKGAFATRDKPVSASPSEVVRRSIVAGSGTSIIVKVDNNFNTLTVNGQGHMSKGISLLKPSSIESRSKSMDDDKESSLVIDMNDDPAHRPKLAPKPSLPQPPTMVPVAAPKPRPHIREAVDPAKYVKVHDTEGLKYACSKCGNLYKWRKSLNKHWKEKHDGEIPTPVSAGNFNILNIPRLHTTTKSVTMPNTVRHLETNKDDMLAKYKSQLPQHQQSSATRQFVMGSAQSPFARPMPVLQAQRQEQNRNQHSRSFSESTVIRPGSSAISPRMTASAVPTKATTPNRPFGSYSNKQYLTPDMMAMSRSRNQPIVHHPLQAKNLGLPSPPVAHSQTFAPRQALLSPPSPPDDVQPLDLSSSAKYQAAIPPPRSPDLGILDLSVGAPTSNTQRTSSTPVDFSRKVNYSKTEVHVNMVSPGSGRGFPPTPPLQEMVSPRGYDGLQCSKCAFVAQTKEEYNRHTELHLLRRNHKCGECQLMFQNVEELNDHFAASHIDLINKYAVSGVLSPSQPSPPEENPLYRYLNLAPNPQVQEQKIVTCMVCSSSYQWRWDLARHFKSAHPTLPNPYSRRRGIEEDEDEVTIEEPSEKRYRISEPSLQCNKCAFTAKNQSELTRHQLVHSLEKTFLCNSCSFNTKSKEEFMLHMRHAHRVNIDGATAMRYAQSTIRPTESIQGDPGAYSPDDISMNSPNSEEQMPATKPTAEMPSAAGSSMQEYTEDGTTIVIPQAPESSVMPQTPPKEGRALHLKGSSSSAEALLPYKCSVCEYRARWPSEITQHMKNHSDEKPFHCPRCSYKSKWKWDVVKHLKRCGGGTVKDVIDKSGNFRKGIIKVMSQEHGGSILSNGPPNVTLNTSEMPEHEGYHGNDNHTNGGEEDDEMLEAVDFSDSNGSWVGEFDKKKGESQVCEKCSFMTHSPAELKRHMQMHSDEKPYICRTCGYSTKWKCDLKKHVRTYDHVAAPLPLGEDLLQDDDDASQESDEKMEQDLSQPTRTLYKCDNCPYVSYKKHFMDSHMKIHEKQSGKIGGGSGKFKCKQCDYEAHDLLGFIQHKRSHSASQNSEFNSDADKMDVDSGKVDKNAADANASSRHRRKQTKPEYRQIANDAEESDDTSSALPFRCTKCPYATANTAGLEKHVQFHGGLGQYICEWCDWSVDSLRTLYQHAKHVHNGEMSKLNGKTFLEKVCIKSNTSMEFIDVDDLDAIMKMDQQEAERMEEECDDSDVDTMFNMLNPFAPKPVSSPKSFSGLERLQDPDTPDNLSSPGSPYSEKSRSRRNRKIKTCPKCGYITDNMTNLQRHLDKHGQQAKYVCDYCDYSLDRLGQVQLHMKTIHTKEWFKSSNEEYPEEKLSFGQTKPLRAFSISPTLSENETVRSSSTETDLRDMDVLPFERFGGDFKSSPSMVPRVKHPKTSKQGKQKTVEILHIGGKRRYKCSKCNYVSQNVSSVAGHVKNHGNQRRFTCSLCDYSVDQNHLIDNHLTSCHGTINYMLDEDNNRASPQIPVATNGREAISSPNLEYSSQSLSINQTMSAATTHPTIAKQIAVSPKKSRAKKLNILNKIKANLNASKVREKFQCNHCAYSTFNRACMVKHRKLHLVARKYQCHLCSYSATRANLLHQHLLYHRNGFSDTSIMEKPEPSLMAPIAGTEAGTDSPQKKKKAQTCNKCHYSCTTVLELKKHRRYHGANLKFKCNCCDYSIDRVNLLQNHMNRHHDNVNTLTQFKCNLCEYKSNSAESLETHIMTHSTPTKVESEASGLWGGDKKFQCDICPFACDTKQRLSMHQQLHGSSGKHKCKHCNFAVDQVDTLYQHSRLHTKMDSSNTHSAQAVKRRLKCPKCPYHSHSPTLLQSHLKMHSSEMEEAQTKKQTIPKQTTVKASTSATTDGQKRFYYRCQECPYQTNNKGNFENHKLQHGAGSRLLCPYCNYSSGLTGQIFSHIRIHFPGASISNCLLKAIAAKANPGIDSPMMLGDMKGDIESFEEKYLTLHVEESGAPTINQQLQCPYCNFSSGLTGQIYAHLRKHFPGANLSSVVLKAMAAKLNTGVDAVKMPNDTKKEIEGLEKQSFTSLKEEVETNNNGPMNRSPLSKQKVQFLCQYCDSQFDSRDLVLQHEMQHL